MTKKLTALILICTFLLAACGRQTNAASTPTPSATATVAVIAAPTQTAPAADDGYLHITMLGITQTGARESENDILTPIWRERTGVAAQVVSIPGYEDYTAFLSGAIDGGTLPDVIALETGVFDVPERYNLLKEGGVLLEISYEDVAKYMPLTAERLKSMGISLREWYDANVDLDTGTWLYIPSLPSPLFDENIRLTRYGIDLTDLPLSYIWVRDDILSAIIPGAITALDLSVQFSVNGENVAIETVLDWNVGNFTALTDYLAAVKALCESEGYAVTPMRPLYNNTAGAITWSLFSAGGSTLTGNFPEFTADLGAHYTQTAGWKDYIAWLNQCDKAGYFPQSFLAGDVTSGIDGSYAVVNGLAAAPVKSISPLTGIEYGWRLYPMFMESAVNDEKASTVALSLTTAGAVGFNKNTVTQEMLPALLAWVDWNYSLEAQNLRNWGEGMTTGEGDKQRFTSEFLEVQDYMLNGTQSARDGWYYGLVNVSMGTYERWNHEVYGIGGGDVGQHAPAYVYSISQMNFDQTYLIPYMVKKHLLTSVLEMDYVLADSSPEARERAAELGALYELYKAAYAKNVTLPQSNAMTSAVKAETKQFESAYAAFLKVYEGSKAQALQNELAALIGGIKDE